MIPGFLASLPPDAMPPSRWRTLSPDDIHPKLLWWFWVWLSSPTPAADVAVVDLGMVPSRLVDVNALMVVPLSFLKTIVF